MVVYVKNRAGKKLHCIVDGLASHADRGPVGSSSHSTSSAKSSSDRKQNQSVSLRALSGRPSAAATPRNALPPAVLVVHGFKGFSTQRHIAAIAKSLVDAGFITLRPDLTKNPGKSYLPFEDMTYEQELLDCEDVLDFLLKMPQVDKSRVGLTGHSLGGMLAAQLAAERDEVKSLAALSAVYDFEFVVEHLFNKPYKEAFSDFKTKGWSTVWSQSLSRKFRINRSFYEDIIKRNAKKFTRDIKCPTLIVSSGNDESVAQIHADNYLKGVGAKVKKMEIIEGSDHNYTTTSVLDQICQLVSGWFLSTL